MNERCIANLNGNVWLIKAEDYIRDLETGACTISILGSVNLNQTANRPRESKVGVAPKVILTENVNLSDQLINESVGTVKHIDIGYQSKLHLVMFDGW